MADFFIETNVPAPKHPRFGTSKYPFGDMPAPKGMECASFFAPDVTPAALMNAAAGWRRKHPEAATWKWRAEVATGPDGEQGARIWRIK